MRATRVPERVPPIGTYAIRLGHAIVDGYPSAAKKKRLEAVIKYRKTFNSWDRARLVSALRAAADRFSKYADRLEEP